MSIIYVDAATYDKMWQQTYKSLLVLNYTQKGARDQTDYLMRDWRRMGDTTELQKDLDDDKEGLTQ